MSTRTNILNKYKSMQSGCEVLLESATREYINTLYDSIADAQRSRPEALMVKAQRISINRVWNELLEHAGDLIHRMTQNISWYEGCYDEVKNKVNKCLRYIDSNDIQSFDSIVFELFEYQSKRGTNKFPTASETIYEMNKAGKEYAYAHWNLDSQYNRLHILATEAAAYSGECEFDKAKQSLLAIKAELDKGKANWRKAIWEYNNSK